MKKVYLIQPPIEDFYTTPIRNISLGLIQIGTILKNSFEVRVFDLRYNKKKKITPPDVFKPLLQYYHEDNTSPFSLYKNYYRFGYNTSEFVENLTEPPDYFAISCICTTYSPASLELIQVLKSKFPNSSIIVGGTDASLRPDLYLSKGADFVIKGEGDLALKKLLKALGEDKTAIKNIRNLIWKKGKKIIYNKEELVEDLNSLPFPDYLIEGVPKYTIENRQHAMIITGRGCPYKCKFCSIGKTMGYYTRLRSVENVIEEINEKIKSGITSFDFEDDNLGHNKKWFNHFLDNLLEYFNKENLYLYAMNGITASNIDKTTIVKMKKAGFRYINLSLVTPDTIAQKALKRPFTTRAFLEAVNHANKTSLPIIAYLILGMPGDTVDRMLNSILFLASTQCLIGPSIFYITPESDIYYELKKKKQLPQDVQCLRSTYIPYTDRNFTRKDIITLFIIVRIINFLKQIVDRNLKPSNFEIEKGRIIIRGSPSGKQTKITIGFALLKLLFQEGKLYYTGKKEKNFYPLIEENVSTEILKKFLDSRWVVKGYLSNRLLSREKIKSIFR